MTCRRALIAAALVACAGGVSALAQSGETGQSSREQQLLAGVSAEPAHIPNYLELAGLYFQAGRLDDAERLLRAASGLLEREFESESSGVPYGPEPEPDRPPQEELVLAPPAFVAPVDLSYPESVLAAGIGGLVVLDIEVSPAGTVIDVRDPEPPPPDKVAADYRPRIVDPRLRAAAVAAVRGAAFRPPGTDVDAGAIVVRAYANFDAIRRQASLRLAPGRPDLTGYLFRARQLSEIGSWFEAGAAIDGALDVVKRQRRAPGRVWFSRDARDVSAPFKPPLDTSSPFRVVATWPEYPLEALTAGVGGRVKVWLVIDEQGRVTDVDVLESAPGLETAVMEVARRWVYVPGHLMGQPVPHTTTATVTFDADTGLVVPRLVGGVEIPYPRKRRGADPKYTSEALIARELDVQIVVDAVIDRRGKVVGAAARSPRSASLGRASEDALKTWEFDPSRVNGRPVEISFAMEFGFRVRAPDQDAKLPACQP